MDRNQDFPLFSSCEILSVKDEIPSDTRQPMRQSVKRVDRSKQQPLLPLKVDAPSPAPVPLKFSPKTSKQPAREAGQRPHPLPEQVARVPTLEPVQQPMPARRPETFQDLVDFVASRPHRSEQQQRVTVAQLRAMAWILTTNQARTAGRLSPVARGEPVLATIPCDPVWINDHLPHYSLGVFRMSRQSFGNAIGTCRREMALAGLIRPPSRPRLPEDSTWGQLFAALDKTHAERTGPEEGVKRPKLYGSMDLRTLGVWSHGHDIQPLDMCDEVIERFATDLKNNQLREDIAGYVRGAANLWNGAVKAGLVGSTARLLTVTRKKPTYTLATINPEFDTDIRELEAALSGGNRKGPRRRSEPAKLKPETIEMYLYRVRQAVTAHHHHVSDRASIRLADLFEPGAFDNILLFFYHRTRTVIATRKGEERNNLPEDVGVTSQTSGIANALMWVARNHLKLPPAMIDELQDKASAFHPKKPDDLNPKVRARLDQLTVPKVQVRLLRLPWTLMRMAAESKDDNPKAAARMAMVAAAVAILIYCPLRLSNLVRLRIGRNLVYDFGGKQIEKLLIPTDQMKNGKLYEWPFDLEPARLVQLYMRDYRPILVTGENDWLFPGDRGVNTPRSNNALADAITGMVEAHVGVEVHVHLFRSFAACLLLERGAPLNDVRLLLGHKAFETTLKYYAYLRPKIVASRHASVIREAMYEHDPLMRDWFSRKSH